MSMLNVTSSNEYVYGWVSYDMGHAPWYDANFNINNVQDIGQMRFCTATNSMYMYAGNDVWMEMTPPTINLEISHEVKDAIEWVNGQRNKMARLEELELAHADLRVARLVYERVLEEVLISEKLSSEEST